MVACRHEAAGTTRPARTIVRVVSATEQGGREVDRERRLADACRPCEEERMRQPAGEHRPDRRDGGGLTPGSCAVHGRPMTRRSPMPCDESSGVAASRSPRRPHLRLCRSRSSWRAPTPTIPALELVVLRVRRFVGASPAGAAVAVGESPIASGAGSVVRRRVVRRFGAASAAPSDAGVADPEPAATAPVALRRVVRRVVAAGAAGSAPASGSIGAKVVGSCPSLVVFVRRRPRPRVGAAGCCSASPIGAAAASAVDAADVGAPARCRPRRRRLGELCLQHLLDLGRNLAPRVA